jgi:hypothetical protein
VKDNLFLPPAEDPVVRETLSGDDTLRGKFAALFMDSVSGARVAGNRFFGFSPNEQTIAKTAEAADVEAADNVTLKLNDEALVAVLHFGEWFGDTTANDARGGKADPASVKGAARIAGRIGGAVSFDGKGSSVAVPASSLGSGSSLTGFTLALWVRPAEGGATTQTIASAGDADGGFALAVVDGRLVASAWDAGKTATLDLGPAVSGGVWQHVALTYDAQTGSLVGSVNGVEAAATKSGVPSRLAGFSSGLSLGVNAAAVKIGDRTVDPGAGAYAGAVDELYFFVKPQSAERIASLALQLRPAGK